MAPKQASFQKLSVLWKGDKPLSHTLPPLGRYSHLHNQLVLVGPPPLSQNPGPSLIENLYLPLG